MASAGLARGDWSFAILGDTRGPHHTTTGVSPDLHAIATKIASMNPDLVLHCGDLCNGDDTNASFAFTYNQQFDHWKSAMNPVTAVGIPIYTVRGNHENACGEGPPLMDLKQAYYDACGVWMPTNGPSNSSTDNQSGFTYSFTHSNATFIVLDQYFYYNATAEEGYHSIDQTWLDQQLQQANNPYVVVMAHAPVFNSHFFGTNTAAQSTFWDSLGTNGSRLYICGHVHNLSVCLAPDAVGNMICQLLAGNGGAPLDTAATNYDPGVTVIFTNDTNYGFAWATVGSNAMTIDYYLLDTTSNTWSRAAYTTVIPANNPLSSPAGAEGGEWLVLDHPASVATFPRAVSGNTVVGSYYATAIQEHGFVFDGTTWTDLDYPGAIYTRPHGISDKTIVGDYTTDPAAQIWHSFVWDGKTWTTLDCPGAVATHAFGAEGKTIVGNYFDGRADQGFVYEKRTWVSLNKSQASQTFVNGISHEAVVGDYVANDLTHGFLYDGANWTTLDAPGASATHCWGISGRQVVGSFWSGPPGERGFIYNWADATWTALDFPGAQQTQPFGIDGKSIVGSFRVGDTTHGFLYRLTPDPAGDSAHAEGWVVGATAADGYGVILHTSNGGYRWDRQGSTNAIPNTGLNNVKAVDRHTAWVVGKNANGYGIILRTDDGGRNWVRQGQPGMIPDLGLQSIGTANRKTAWVVGSQGTILRTDNGGETWVPQVSGTKATLFEVAVVNSRIAWAAGDVDSGYPVVLHTTNGGQTWERQGTAATLSTTTHAVVVNAVNARTAWVVGQHGLVSQTTDGGASWHIQMGAGGYADNNDVCGVDPNTAWIAADYNTVYRTTNGGTTWDRQNVPVPLNYYLMAVSARGRNTAWVTGMSNPIPNQGIILHTTDGGATWGIQTPPVNVPFERGISFVGSQK